jgi:hypothetical protein
VLSVCHDDLDHHPCLDVFSCQPWLLQPDAARTASELFRRSPGVIDAVDRGIKNTAMVRAARPNQAAARNASWMADASAARTRANDRKNPATTVAREGPPDAGLLSG